VSTKQITDTARTLRRRLARAQARSTRPAAEARGGPVEDGADDARLDALRGELVHELDRLAAADSGCSAGFRRI
jgi:hypothetical protein